MKKYTVIFLSVIFMLILWGCRNVANPNTPSDITEVTAVTTVTEPTGITEATEALQATRATKVTRATIATKAPEITHATTATKATEITRATTATQATATTPPTSPAVEQPCAHYWGRWIDTVYATCKTAGQQERTCRLCDATETRATEKTSHKKSDWLLGKPAQVGVEGMLYKQCIYCKTQLQTQTVPAITNTHQHAITTWVTVREANCTNTGLKNALCSCGKVMQSKELPASHSPMTDLGEPATCFVTGLTEGSHCWLCDKVLVQQKIIAKLPHTPETDEAVPATCANFGYTEGSHCSVCFTVIVKQNTIEKLPHTPVIDKAVTATCASKGLTEGSHCSVCSSVIVKQNTIEKLPHTPVIDKAVTATCTSTGLTEGSHCSVCGSVIVKQKPIAKIAHTLVAGVCSCGATESLEFTLSLDSNYYILSGIGTYTGTDIIIPETYNGLPVKEIAASAFYSNQTITSVRFHNSIQKIGRYAFFRCVNLSGQLQFPASLQEIGECAFAECSKLTDVTFGPALQTIGYAAFRKCSQLKTLTIPASVTKIDKYAFEGCSSVTDVYFEKTTTWVCYYSTYPGSTMGEAALSYSKGACTFLINSYCDRVWERS